VSPQNPLPSVKYRPALRLFGRVLALQLLVVAAINFLVNPFRLYPTHLEPPLITDDHTTKLELLRDRRPRLLVLGSSRVMKLEPAYLERKTGLPAFNLGVASGQMEDSLCLFRYATERLGLRPEWILLGVDVDSFHPTAPVNPQLLKDPRLRRCLPPELRPSWTTALYDLTQLLTLDQLKASCRALGPRPAQGETSYDPDGLMHHVREREPLDLGRDMRPCMQRYVDFPHLSPSRLRYLDELARLCRRRGIRLTVFLTTVHEQYRRSVAASYLPRYGELAPLLRRKAAAEGFRFFDASRVEFYGGDPNDFYDSSHINAGNARRIINHVVQ
jgi:hypothetical protein